MTGGVTEVLLVRTSSRITTVMLVFSTLSFLSFLEVRDDTKTNQHIHSNECTLNAPRNQDSQSHTSIKWAEALGDCFTNLTTSYSLHPSDRAVVCE